MERHPKGGEEISIYDVYSSRFLERVYGNSMTRESMCNETTLMYPFVLLRPIVIAFHSPFLPPSTEISLVVRYLF